MHTNTTNINASREARAEENILRHVVGGESVAKANNITYRLPHSFESRVAHTARIKYVDVIY
jgi:hypothetical protein